jgi:general secretion pathway protein C
MQAISLKRFTVSQTAAVSLVTCAACALLGLVLAYWTWAWLAPRAEARAPAVVQTGGAVDAAYGLFGSASPNRSGAAPTSGAITLLGLVAGSGNRSGSQSGYAVLRIDAKKTVVVLQGQEVEPGLRLVEVHVNHIILERNGARQTLAWPEKNSK